MVIFFSVPVNLLVAALNAGKDDIVSVLGEGIFKVLIGLILTIFLVVAHIMSLVTLGSTAPSQSLQWTSGVPPSTSGS